MLFTTRLNNTHSFDGTTIGVLAAVHALVDGCCAVLVFSLLHLYPLGRGEYWLLVVAYNILAFALQPICGILVDRYITARMSAIIGLLLSIAAVVLYNYNPYMMIIAAGLGNAFFHSGGGVASMTIRKGAAGPAGIFVAPGTIGLALGAAIGSRGVPPMVPMLALLSAAMVVVVLCRFRDQDTSAGAPGFNGAHREVIIALLLASVALRSFLGFSIGSDWQGNRAVLIGFVIAAAFGKALGGIIADTVGWVKMGSIALVIVALCGAGSAQHVWCAFTAMLLLQSTMPLTLAALYRMFPQQPGLTFGLCCLALMVGAAPVFSSLKSMLFDKNIVMAASLLTIITFIAGLRMVMVRVEPILTINNGMETI